MIHPSRTATLYRVAYRRTDREPRKGYTYKVFKGETQARAFIERLAAPPDDKTPERFRELAPLAEVHLHLATVRWEPVDPSTANDVLDHTGEVTHRGESWSRDELLARYELLLGKSEVALDEAHVEACEIAELLS